MKQKPMSRTSKNHPSIPCHLPKTQPPSHPPLHWLVLPRYVNHARDFRRWADASRADSRWRCLRILQNHGCPSSTAGDSAELLPAPRGGARPAPPFCDASKFLPSKSWRFTPSRGDKYLALRRCVWRGRIPQAGKFGLRYGAALRKVCRLTAVALKIDTRGGRRVSVDR